MNVGYVQCYEQPTDGSLDSTLIRVMSCNNVENGGSVQTVYTNGDTQILYPKDPIAVDSPPPPPPPLPEDQPAEALTIAPTDPLPETMPVTTNEAGNNNALLIGGGLLLLFLLLGKKKKRK